MTYHVSLAVRALMLQAKVDALDGAATAGKLLLYSSDQPTTGGGTPTGTLQATIELSRPCAVVSTLPESDLAVMEFVADVEGQRVAEDAIGWGRLVDGDGNYVADGKVLLAGAPGSAEFRISNTVGYAGSFVRIDSGTVAL